MLDLNKHTVKQLRSMVKSMGVGGYSKLRKAELVKLAYAVLEHQRLESEKISKQFTWTAQIMGRGRCGLLRKVLEASTTTSTGLIRKEVKIEFPNAQDGDIYEWRQKATGCADQGGFVYHKNGQLVPVAREFVELLV